MTEEFEAKFIKPIVNASYPGTLATLNLAALQIGRPSSQTVKNTLLLGSLAFLLSALFVFFYSIYPARKKLWTSAAMTFLLGLGCSVISVLSLFISQRRTPENCLDVRDWVAQKHHLLLSSSDCFSVRSKSVFQTVPAQEYKSNPNYSRSHCKFSLDFSKRKEVNPMLMLVAL